MHSLSVSFGRPGSCDSHPPVSPSAHVDVSAHENACVSCRSALKLVSISSLVIINFPLMLPCSQRHSDVNGCPSARRGTESPAEEFNKCARVCVRSVLTAQCNDVAAVFMDKLLRHRLLHDLLHLHTKKWERQCERLTAKTTKDSSRLSSVSSPNPLPLVSGGLLLVDSYLMHLWQILRNFWAADFSLTSRDGGGKKGNKAASLCSRLGTAASTRPTSPTQSGVRSLCKN